jgi:FecR protein
MSIARCSNFLTLLLTASLTTFPYTSPAAATSPQTPPDRTYDQIVRLSLVEGDVRVSRGKEGEHATGDEWEHAAVNLPIQTGFSLVTGKGRAAIELEDASTVYLGDNSVLIFTEVTTTNGIPHTEISLVSGTATLHLQLTLPGERFTVRTPTDGISLQYPGKTYVRVNSYIDAMALTPQEELTLRVANTPQRTAKGQTLTLSHEHVITPETMTDPEAFTEWDDWTAKHVAAWNTATTAAMKDAGLTSPIPGLAEMKDQGTFFACAPYGTCWQPTNGWENHVASSPQASAHVDAQVETPLETRQSPNPSQQQPSPSASLPLSTQALQSASPAPILRTEYGDWFPCSPNRVRYLIARNPLNGKDTVIRTELDPYAAPYAWAVCHTGSWIHREHGYAWVAGTKRHHHCPVHWVKYGNTKGYVPIHPHDVAGKPPINLKHGVFETSGRKGESVQHVAFNSSTPVKLLDTTPKEFAKPYFPPLQRAETPRLEAHLVKDGPIPGRDTAAKLVGTPITFDHKSQSFVMARQITQGNRNTTVTEHFGGRSENFQAHNSGGNFASGNSSFRGGSSGSYNHSSSNTASASHSSASGGGGGGFHGSSGGGGGGGGASSGGGSHK